MEAENIAVDKGLCNPDTMFQPINYPPGLGWEDQAFYKNRICPHFELICEAATLVGIERKAILERKDFCGRYFTMMMRSGDSSPSELTTECERIAEMLGKLIQEAEPATKNPLPSTYNGRFHLVINCPGEKLGEKLRNLLSRLAGQEPLSVLKARIMKLRPGKFHGHENLEMFREAKTILKKLVHKTMGPSVTASAIPLASIYISCQGKQSKRKGCKLYPDLK